MPGLLKANAASAANTKPNDHVINIFTGERGTVKEVKQSYAIITYNGSTASDKQEYYCFKKLDAPL